MQAAKFLNKLADVFRACIAYQFGNLLHVVPIKVQKLLYEVTINVIRAWC